MLDPVGFWSYARLDDEHSDGQLSQLRAVVGKAIGMQHGEKVTLWQDIQAIPYGSDWATEIEETIGKTTFFIPIVTPRFLKSENCRDEYLSYRRRMLALGRDDLIFPVHYVNVEGLTPEDTVFGDDLAMLRRAQWIDFRPLFYDDPKSEKVRRWAGDFAGEILQAMRRETPARGRAAKAVQTRESASPAIVAKEAPLARPAIGEGETAPVGKETAPPMSSTPQKPSEPAPSPSSPRPSAPRGNRAAWIAVVLVVVLAAVVLTAIVTRPKLVDLAPLPEDIVQTTPEASPSAPAPRASRLAEPEPDDSTPAPSPSLACGGGLLPRTTAALTAAEECELKPKDAFKECADCPEMVVVPAGEFLMGSPDGELYRSSGEGPQHRVTIGRPFAVSKYPITVGELRAFATDTKYNIGSGVAQASASWRNPGFPQTDAQPVTLLDWYDVQEYINWLAGKTGGRYRLLSEAEWEYSERGGTTTAYFWGDEIGKAHANCRGCGSPWEDKQTSAVGSFPSNAFGLYDMAGNVWERTLDCYHETYVSNGAAPSDGSAWTDRDCRRQVLRGGGSWKNGPVFPRSAVRTWSTRDGRANDVGFRVARTLAP